MGIITFSTLLLVVFTAFIKKIISAAPLRYNDEDRFTEAINYEESFSHLYYNIQDVTFQKKNKTFL